MRLYDRVIGWRIGQRSILTKARYGDVDQAGIEGPQLLTAEIQLVHDTRSEIVDDDVGFLDESMDQTLTGRFLQVDPNGLFAAIAVGEERRDSSLGRPYVPHGVAHVGGLDLDHSRTLFGHHHGGEGRCNHGRELDYCDIFERFHRLGLREINSLNKGSTGLLRKNLGLRE